MIENARVGSVESRHSYGQYIRPEGAYLFGDWYGVCCAIGVTESARHHFERALVIRLIHKYWFYGYLVEEGL